MLQDAIDSFGDIFSPPFRNVMVKSLALTIAMLVVAGFGLDRLALTFVHVQSGWLATAISLLVGLGLVAGHRPARRADDFAGRGIFPG